VQKTVATLIALICTAISIILGGCSDADQADAPEPAPATVTVIETRQAATPPPAPAPAELASTPVESVTPAEARGITVPDVVGRDHQYAQDTMQAAGLYNLAEEDATGQGRALLWDRNWVVVAQSPAAGSRVDEDTTIILRSKKDGE
jgi:cytochrome bd-type quinol oxidase subunit 1